MRQPVSASDLKGPAVLRKVRGQLGWIGQPNMIFGPSDDDRAFNHLIGPHCWKMVNKIQPSILVQIYFHAMHNDALLHGT